MSQSTSQDKNMYDGVFVGQLFRGDPKSKNWSPLIGGQVGVSLRQEKGVWSMVAVKKEKVWEGKIEPGFKHRFRDSFVQWQQKGLDGSIETYGLRLKSNLIAKQMSELLTQLLTKMEEAKRETVVAAPSNKQVQQSLPSMLPDDVVLKVFLSGKDSTNVCVPSSATVQQVLKSVCQRRDLDPSHFVVTLPPNSPTEQPIQCKGHMTVGDLSTNEIHLSKRRKSGRQESSSQLTTLENSGESEQMLLLQVELPKGERTVVRVSPSLSMSALLQYVCEKRNIDVINHRFDLPATEESLAGKTLKELKINTIRVISKVPDSGSDQSANSSPSSRKKKHKTKERASSVESPKNSRRHAPPPPPAQRRRTQPDFMRELTAEMAGRKVTRPSHDTGTTPTGSNEYLDIIDSDTSPTKREEPEIVSDQSNHRMTTTTSRGALKPRSAPAPPPPTGNATPPETRTHPPPVAVKPYKKKHRRENSGTDETDSALTPVKPVEQVPPEDSVVLKGQEVVGVKGKVKDHKERSDLTESITEALKRQTDSAERRYTGLPPRKRTELVTEERMTRHGSLEKERVARPKMRSHDNTPTLVHDVMVPVDIPSEEDEPRDRTTTLPASLIGRKPRGPAPRPPPSIKTHRTSHDQLTNSLPADIRLKTNISKSNERLDSLPDEHTKKERSKVGKFPRKRPSRPAPVPPPVEEVEEVEVQEQILDFKATSLSPESTPPPDPQPSPPSQGSSSHPSPNTPRRSNAATAICQDTEDGGKVLIVQPSPSADRKLKSHTLVFKLPPPPPQPNFGGNKEKKDVEAPKDEGAVEKKTENVTTKDLPVDIVPLQDDTILSNEYTNLDDTDEDELTTTNFSNMEHEDMGMEDKDGTGMEQNSSDTDPSSMSEEGYDITVDDQPDFYSTPSSTKPDDLPPPLNEEHLTLNLSLNSNSNNSNDSGDEIEAIPLPLPPDEFLHSDSSLDSSSASVTEQPLAEVVAKQPEQPTEEPSGGILLLSLKKIDETPLEQPSDEPCINPREPSVNKVEPSIRPDVPSIRPEEPSISPEEPSISPEEPSISPEEPSISPEDPPVVPDVQEGWVDKVEDGVGNSIGTQLNELDSVVADLRDLLNTEDTAPPTMPTPPPPPPLFSKAVPPVTTSRTTHTPPAVTSPNRVKKSPIPAKPKPPPVVTAKAPPTNTPPSKHSPVTNHTPVTIATRTDRHDVTEEKQTSNELLEKFKERRAKMKSTDNPITNLTNPIPNSNNSIPQVPPPAGNEAAVHAQLQFLQQQVLQQQMIQLQQQFQQLQSLSMHPNTGMGVHGVGMGVPGMGMGVPGMGMVPGQYQASPMMYPHQPVMLGGQPPVLPQAMPGTMQMPPGQVLPGFANPQTNVPLYGSQAVGYSTHPHNGAIQMSPTSEPTPPPPPSQPPPSTSSPVVPRKLSEDHRSNALGEIEDKFDALMDEVRETDPNNVLKKVPDQPTASTYSYTGMAAALATALKQRRQHFDDKRRSRDMDESIGEWQSP